MRLAEHVEGTTDVDGMLESMTVEQFDEWAAKDMIEPVGYQSQMLGLIGWYLYGALNTDGELKPEDFMPWLRYHKQKADNAGARAFLKGLAGGNTR